MGKYTKCRRGDICMGNILSIGGGVYGGTQYRSAVCSAHRIPISACWFILLLILLPSRRHGLTAKYIDISFGRCRNIVPYCKSFKMSNFFFFEFLRTLVSIGLNWSKLV